MKRSDGARLDGTDFSARKVQGFRATLGLPAAPLLCPYCSKTYTQKQELSLWTHAKDQHRHNLGAIFSTPEDEARGRDEFLRIASKDTKPKATLKSPHLSSGEPGSPPKHPAPPTYSEPTKPSTPPGQDTKPEKKIQNLEQLTLGTKRISSTAGNPLKRGPIQGSSSPDSLPGSNPIGRNLHRERYERPHSSELTAEKDRDFDRGGPPSREAAHRRSNAKPSRRLFDHTTDGPGGGHTARKKKDQRQGRSGPNPQRTRPAMPDHISYDTQKQAIPNATQNSPGPVVLEQRPALFQYAVTTDQDLDEDIQMLRQPETRPISYDQLVAEVKGIYAGLVMVEAKTIEVDQQQSIAAQEDPARRPPLPPDKWRALVALHKQLLHEHHDFFLASQHPAATPNLSRLAFKYSMPARMWRHGIHSFLEVLRHRLPESLEQMLCFIYIAYSMVALLYETVPTFEDTWVECLGDLGRYRMAIEDEDPKDREIWSGVARYWYGKACDASPHMGRLYHHLAILARPYTSEQLSLYLKALTCIVPFESARGSIMTLFGPILSEKESIRHLLPALETIVVKAHGILFTYPDGTLQDFVDTAARLKNGLFDDYIGKSNNKFKKTGVWIATSNNTAILEFGALTARNNPRSLLRRAFILAIAQRVENTVQEGSTTDPSSLDNHKVKDVEVIRDSASRIGTVNEDEASLSSLIVCHASDLAFSMFRIVIAQSHWEDSILPFVHVQMVFLFGFVSVGDAMSHIERDVPWTEMCAFLNHLSAKPGALTRRVWCRDFPKPDPSDGIGRPLPEDYDLRGQLYAMDYFPETWFIDSAVDTDERNLEMPSMDAARRERILWIGNRVASVDKWISYDGTIRAFVTTDYTKKLAAQFIGNADITTANAPTTNPQHAASSKTITVSMDTNTDPAEQVNEATAPSTMLDYQPADHMNDMETPRTAAEEHDDDIPMMDISPGKEAPPTTLVQATASPPWPAGNAREPERMSPTKSEDVLLSNRGEARIIDDDDVDDD